MLALRFGIRRDTHRYRRLVQQGHGHMTLYRSGAVLIESAREMFCQLRM